MPRPIPREPPVTRATRPSSLMEHLSNAPPALSRWWRGRLYRRRADPRPRPGVVAPRGALRRRAPPGRRAARAPPRMGAQPGSDAPLRPARGVSDRRDLARRGGADLVARTRAPSRRVRHLAGRCGARVAPLLNGVAEAPGELGG